MWRTIAAFNCLHEGVVLHGSFSGNDWIAAVVVIECWAVNHHATLAPAASRLHHERLHKLANSSRSCGCRQATNGGGARLRWKRPQPPPHARRICARNDRSRRRARPCRTSRRRPARHNRQARRARATRMRCSYRAHVPASNPIARRQSGTGCRRKISRRLQADNEAVPK